MDIDNEPRKAGFPADMPAEPDWERDILSDDESEHAGTEENEEAEKSTKQPCQQQDDLAGQLTQLQELVREMKTSFSTALSALASVQYGDQLLQEKVDNNRIQYEQQLADVVQMVLALKTEFGQVVGQLQQATEAQRQLQRQVEWLQCERDILLEELEKAGSITDSLRQKYHSGQSRPNGLCRANDSTLSVLLERARRAFNDSHHSMVSDHDSGVTTYQHGDASSCGEVTPPSMSPMVQSYIAGLPNGHEAEPPLEENYDSDSSLTMAANKSLDMSRSLGDHVAEVTQVDTSEDEGTEEDVDNRQKSRSSPQEKEMEEQITPSTAEKSSSSPESHPVFKRPESPRKVAPHERNSRELARSRVAREILETEQTYCSCLWTVLDHFACPLRQTSMLASKEVNTIFPPCLGRIYDLHCDLLLKLEDRLANWKWHGVVGDIFARFLDSESELLHLYQAYVNDFPAALQQIQKSCKQSLRFRKFLRKCQLAPCCRGMELPAFLLTPIQRMPRYVLLLKQLLRHTDEDHPDHYHLEASLQRLGSFLTQLNDSIEFSMSVVAAQTTPRPKRKRRVGSSFRSSSMSSYDAMQMSSANRDSGIHSNGESQSSMVLNLAALRDRLVNRNNAVGADMSAVSLPEPGYQHQPPPSLYESNHNHTFNGTTAVINEDASSNREKSCTLPHNGYPRRPLRSRRPKSAGVLGHNATGKNIPHGVVPNSMECGLNNSRGSNSDVTMGRPPRPHSMVEPLSDSSFHNQQSNVCIARHTPVMSQVYPNRSESFNSQHSNHLSPHDYTDQAFGDSVKSLPEVIKQTSAEKSRIDSLNKRSSRIPKDYGIYGDKDDIIEEEVYQPYLDNGNKQKQHRLGVPRSKSHGNILVQDGSASPSQQQITMALACSLTEDKLRSEPDISKAAMSDLEDNNISTLSLHPDPSRRGTYNQENGDRGRHIDWQDVAMDTSVSNPSVNNSRHGYRNHWRKKKDRHRKPVDNNIGDLDIGKEKKKGSLKDSLKNLFFKKRKDSPVLVNEPLTSTPKNVKMVDVSLSSDDSHPPVTLDLQTAVADLHAPSATSDPREGDRDWEDDVSPPASPHKEQAPPTENVIVLEGIAPDLQTFQDEDGEPCSAV